MTRSHSTKQTLCALLATGCLVSTAPAFATISGVDTELNGDFNLSPLSYGSSGTLYLSALLYVGDFASALQPKDQVLGSGLSYDYNVSGLGTNVVDIVYTISNTNPGTEDFDAFNDLRFMINAQVDGSNTFMDNVALNWPVASVPGDPDNYQVEVFDLFDDLKSKMQSAGQVSGVNNCVSPCDADFGLQWNRSTLAGGGSESWVVALRLVDDASLVTGEGRFLLATSADTAGTLLYVGNPQLVPIPASYGLLLGALGILGFLRKRKSMGM